MAELLGKLEQSTYRGEIPGKRFEFPANESNKYYLRLFLRGFKKASGKHGLFKWITIRTQWYDWFVVLNVDTGCPGYQTPVAIRSATAVEWLVTA